MKRLIVFLFIIALVAGGFSFVDKAEAIFMASGVDRVCFVSSTKYDGDFETVQCGDKFFNYCTSEQARENAALVKKADAVQFYAEQDKLENLLRQIHFQELYNETVEGIEICYGYSPCYSSAVLLEGKKVNVQVAKVDGQVIVGFPMIMTGY